MNPAETQFDALPGLSVIVIGRNEGARLERCIRSVLDMENPAGLLELIYVDSGSTDDSVDRAQALGVRVIDVCGERPSAALARNAGWLQAKAPLVFFLDGDTILHPAFVVKAMHEFEDPGVAVVWGHRREINTAGSLYNRALDLDWITAPGTTAFCGGDALLRRSVLEQTGGYDENLIAGEEPELCRRIRALGLQILHVDLPMTGHDLAISRWSQYWRRATRTGYAYAQISERFRNSKLPLWETESQSNRNRAIVLSLTVLVSLLASFVVQHLWPLLALSVFLFLLVLRTALKTRWKCHSFATRLLYGVHSHVQQIPIFIGQLQYARDRRTGRNRGLIEYKNTA